MNKIRYSIKFFIFLFLPLLLLSTPSHSFAYTTLFSDNFMSSNIQKLDVYNTNYYNLKTSDDDGGTVFNGKLYLNGQDGTPQDYYNYNGLGPITNPCSIVTGVPMGGFLGVQLHGTRNSSQDEVDYLISRNHAYLYLNGSYNDLGTLNIDFTQSHTLSACEKNNQITFTVDNNLIDQRTISFTTFWPGLSIFSTSSYITNYTIANNIPHNLSGTVFEDNNKNRIQDPGELGYQGATLTISNGQASTQTTTDASGSYAFQNIDSGNYTVTLTLPNGYTATTTNPVSISLSADTTQNFGIAQDNSLVNAINAGGDTQGNFGADTNFSGGTTYTSSAAVDTTGVDNPAPQAVYQTVRYGNFSYSIPNLTANATYTVRLHFNELYWGTDGSDGNGKRVFNVSVNGTQVLSNYDIYQKAGGANKAIIEQLPVTADTNGNLTIQFTTVTDNAMVNGIELYSGTLSSPTPTPTPTPVSSIALNSGAGSTGSFLSDEDYSGGQPYTSTASVDTSNVTNPAPQAVYQSVRYGNFTYTVPNVSPNTTYTVKLHFNELYWGTSLSGNQGGVGSRVFNTAINGQQVLSNYDIFQDAGGANKAVVKSFTTTSDANGKITIVFTTVTDNAMVNGIEISQ